jgi:hypothetical protein
MKRKNVIKIRPTLGCFQHRIHFYFGKEPLFIEEEVIIIYHITYPWLKVVTALAVA